MSMEQIMGLLRHLLTFGGGFVVAQGWLDEATTEQVIGAVITLAGAAWSFFAPEKKAAIEAKKTD